MIAEGQQRIPAIVRKLKDDPNFDYEVIAGARRHWSVTWLREHNYSNMRFLVEVHNLTDEEAFRIADMENRSRQDISDFERAVDYKRAITLYYNGSQQEMADRLRVSKSSLSKLLNMTKLPDAIVSSFGSKAYIGIWHAEQIGPLLNKGDETVARMISEAEKIIAENEAAILAGNEIVKAKDVVKRLISGHQDCKSNRSGKLELRLPIPVQRCSDLQYNKGQGRSCEG